MSDFKWKEMQKEEGAEAIRGMRRLPISCERYSYFGRSQPHPLIKFDSRRGQFYSNEYFKKSS